MIHQHSRIIRRYYGSQVMDLILTAVQEECDLQSSLIFDTFRDSREIDRIIHDIKNYGYPILVNAIYRAQENDEVQQDDANLISLAQVANLVVEMSSMMNHWAMYCKFFVVTWNEAIKTEDKTQAIYPKPLLTSTFMGKIRQILTKDFDTLCTFAVRRTLEKSYLMENIPELTPQLSLCVKYLGMVSKNIHKSTNQSLLSLIPEDPPVSSMIDDVLMSLNMIMLHALSSGEFTTIKSMISNMKRLIETDFLNILKKKLEENQPRANTVLLNSATIRNIQMQQQPNSFYAGSQTGSSANLNGSRSGTPDVMGGSYLVKSINAAININGTEEENSTRLTNFIITLNSISQFQSYLEKLAENLITKLEKDNLLFLDDQQFSQVLQSFEHDSKTTIELSVNLVTSAGTTETPSVQDRIKVIIHTLSSSFNDKSSKTINSQLTMMFNQVFRTKLARLINETFTDGEYLVSSDRSSSLSGTSGSIINFIKEWNSLVIPYLTTMYKSNFLKLMKSIVKFISSSLESKIWSLDKNCNELGAAKLERDVSAIISEITKFDYSLRNEFIRS
ncbi:unnamed protein product [Ambrosiozyma monospora]|uniref:Unnamed protein product n=1 Tax=Ambrosiozyma monospora TaxID=43982 RepID=A0ACB5T8R8_AMBMO|nr:unnamed protein product [Ambrosiozyma monospora]